MIFTPAEADRIATGRKRQHRLPHDRVPPARLTLAPVTTRVPNESLGYDSQGKPKLETLTRCHVRIVDTSPAFLRDATERDARAEGYRSLQSFLDAWERLYDLGPGADVAVTVLTFERETVAGVRFLSTGVVAGVQGDYVTNSMRSLSGEMEAVEDDVLCEYAFDARVRHQAQQGHERSQVRELTLDEQVRMLESEARARHVDVRSELRQIRRYPANSRLVASQLERMRGKLGHPELVAA